MKRSRLLSRWHLSGYDRRKLKAALGTVHDARATRRLQAVLLVAQGHGVRAIARMTNLSHQSVYNALTRYLAHRRPEELVDRPRSGRPRAAPQLTSRRILAGLRLDPWKLHYNLSNWTVPVLARHLERRYRVKISPFTLRRRLHDLRWRCKRPTHRYQHPDPHRAQKKGASNAA